MLKQSKLFINIIILIKFFILLSNNFSYYKNKFYNFNFKDQLHVMKIDKILENNDTLYIIAEFAFGGTLESFISL